MATVVENGVSGYVETDVGRLIEPMRELLADPGEARSAGRGRAARRPGAVPIDRFARDWEDAFAAVTGRPVGGRAWPPGLTPGGAAS